MYYAVCSLNHSKVGNVQCVSSKFRQELLWHPDLLEMHHQQTLSSHFMTTGHYLGIAKGFLVDWDHLFTTSGTQWNHLVTTGRAYLCHVGGNFEFRAKTCRIDKVNNTCVISTLFVYHIVF